MEVKISRRKEIEKNMEVNIQKKGNRKRKIELKGGNTEIKICYTRLLYTLTTKLPQLELVTRLQAIDQLPPNVTELKPSLLSYYI